MLEALWGCWRPFGDVGGPLGMSEALWGCRRSFGDVGGPLGMLEALWGCWRPFGDVEGPLGMSEALWGCWRPFGDQVASALHAAPAIIRIIETLAVDLEAIQSEVCRVDRAPYYLNLSLHN